MQNIKLLRERYLQRSLFKILIYITKIIHTIQVQEIINNCNKPRAGSYAEERVVNAGKKSTVTKIKTKKGQILN